MELTRKEATILKHAMVYIVSRIEKVGNYYMILDENFPMLTWKAADLISFCNIYDKLSKECKDLPLLDEAFNTLKEK